MVDVGVGDPTATGTRRQTLHYIIELAGEVTELRCRLVAHGFSNFTISNTSYSISNIDSINTIVNLYSRGSDIVEGLKNELVVAAGSVLALEIDNVATRSEDFVANGSLTGRSRRVGRDHSKSEDSLLAGDKTAAILLEAALVLALGESIAVAVAIAIAVALLALVLWQLLELELAPLDTAGQGNFGITGPVAVLFEPTATALLDVLVGIVGVLDVQDGPVGKGDGVEMTVGVVGVLNVGLEVQTVHDLVLLEVAR